MNSWIISEIIFQSSNVGRQETHKKLKAEYTDVKSCNKRLTNAVKAASEGNQILKTTLDKIHGTLDDSIQENKLVSLLLFSNYSHKQEF